MNKKMRLLDDLKKEDQKEIEELMKLLYKN